MPMVASMASCGGALILGSSIDSRACPLPSSDIRFRADSDMVSKLLCLDMVVSPARDDPVRDTADSEAFLSLEGDAEEDTPVKLNSFSLALRGGGINILELLPIIVSFPSPNPCSKANSLSTALASSELRVIGGNKLSVVVLLGVNLAEDRRCPGSDRAVEGAAERADDSIRLRVSDGVRIFFITKDRGRESRRRETGYIREG